MTQERTKIIAGIDPGTTTGYAVVDLNGKLIETGAAKEFALDELITKIVSIGTVLLVGCDKAKVPDFVATFATKVGAKVLCPDEDLLVDEKRKIVEQMQYNNSHEMDALASAVFAWKNVEPLFKRIDAILREAKKESLSSEVKATVIKNRMSIKSAIKFVENKDENIFEIQTTTQKVETKQNNSVSTSKITALKNTISKLKQEKHSIFVELSKTKKMMTKLEKKTNTSQQKKEFETKLAFKEQRMISLTNTLQQKEQKILELREQNLKLYQLLSKSKDSVILPRFKNLGWQEYSHRIQKFPVNTNDMIFVDDPYSFSQQTIDELRAKNVTILSNKETNNSVKSIGVAIMKINDIQIDLHPTLAVIKKTDLDKKRKENLWVNDIVEEYQQERKDMLR